MKLSDSVYLKELNNKIVVIIDGIHSFEYEFSIANPQRSNDYYVMDAMSQV